MRTIKYVQLSREAAKQMECYTTGEFGVKSIDYHQAAGEGDRHCCDVHFENGEMSREFKIDNIRFGPEETE